MELLLARLDQLHKIITKRTFRCAVAPVYLFDEDYIRLHGTYSSGNDELDNLIDQTPVRANLNIEQIAEIVCNITNRSDISLIDLYKDSVFIYDTIREYTEKWGEIVTRSQNVRTPPIEFFEMMDKAAEWAFVSARLVKCKKPDESKVEQESFETARRRLRRFGSAVQDEPQAPVERQKAPEFTSLISIFDNRIHHSIFDEEDKT